MKKLILFIGALALATSALAGGGWPQKKGSGFIKIGQWFVIADNFFTPAGDVANITTTAVYSTSVYAEYGFTDRLTGVLYFPFLTRSTLNRIERPDGTLVQEGDELTGVGDTDLSLKYALITNKPIVVSASITLGLPLGNNAGGSTGLLQTGDGEFNQMLTVEASRSFNNVYATLLFGFNNRTNNFSDEIRYGLEVGRSAGKWVALVRFYGIESLNNGNPEFVQSNGIFNNNIEYLAVSPELIYKAGENFGLSAGVGGAFFGRRVLADPSFSVGAFLTF